MFNENSAVGQITPSILRLDDGQTTEVNAKKIRTVLTKFHCFPEENRKALWSFVLQLPENEAAFNALASKSCLPKARKTCTDKGCKKLTLTIFNALIHWYAPLINCDWLPPFVDLLVRSFGQAPLFIFEVTVTFLTNFFADWIHEVPGPPPEVLSRIDAIFAKHDLELRNGLGSSLVTWPVYRSAFAEVMYTRAWIELMDVVISATPQYLEFLVVAWVILNGPMLRLDHTTFHSTKRPINVDSLLAKAAEVYAHTETAAPQLITQMEFIPLETQSYPIIQAKSEAVAMRTLQSDHDKLASLQEQLQEERRKADEAEQIKTRKQQTFASIQQLHHAKEEEERIETAKQAVMLEATMKRLRLEGKRLRLADERHFLESWQNEWESGLDTISRGMQTALFKQTDVDPPVDPDAIRFESMKDDKDADVMAREARKESLARAKQARNELEAQEHQRALRSEIMRLENNPALLMNLSPIKQSRRSSRTSSRAPSRAASVIGSH